MRKTSILLKKHLLFFTLLCSLGLGAQDLYYLHQGQTWTYQWYNAKNEASFKTYEEVLNISNDSSLLNYTIINAFKDTVYQAAYLVQRTEDGSMYNPMTRLLTPDMLSSLYGLDVHLSHQNYLLPFDLKENLALPTFYTHLEAYNQETKILDINLALEEVRIADQEDLNTELGEFACFVMSYELWITQMTRKRFRFRDWINAEVGVIRREVFDRKGRYLGYCELIDLGA